MSNVVAKSIFCAPPLSLISYFSFISVPVFVLVVTSRSSTSLVSLLSSLLSLAISLSLPFPFLSPLLSRSLTLPFSLRAYFGPRLLSLFPFTAGFPVLLRVVVVVATGAVFRIRSFDVSIPRRLVERVAAAAATAAWNAATVRHSHHRRRRVPRLTHGHHRT